MNNMKIRIQEEATRLFREYGYENVSVKKLCEACGISKTTFYFHYKSKHDLALNYFLQSNRDAEKILTSALSCSSTVEQIWQIVLPYFERAQESGVSITREIFREYLYDTASPIVPDNVYMKDTILALVQKAIGTGELSFGLTAEEIYVSIINFTNAYTLQWVIQNGSFDLIEETHKAFLGIYQGKRQEK